MTWTGRPEHSQLLSMRMVQIVCTKRGRSALRPSSTPFRDSAKLTQDLSEINPTCTLFCPTLKKRDFARTFQWSVSEEQNLSVQKASLHFSWNKITECLKTFPIQSHTGRMPSMKCWLKLTILEPFNSSSPSGKA